MYSPNDYDFDLPEELIAQKPEVHRDDSRLLLLPRRSGALSHHRFHELCHFLTTGDVLVINDTRVVPVRLVGKKETGGRVEVLILDYARSVQAASGRDPITCECLVKTARPARSGARIFFDRGLTGEIRDCINGVFSISFFCEENFGGLIEEIGSVPLPPYIRRKADADQTEDRAAYQTVYATRSGAAAAPTAGLHFTRSLLEKIGTLGVAIVAITLHVGYGTFRPVKTTDIRGHAMHREDYTIPEDTAEVINQAKAEGRRVIAVGTTCVRTLEYASDNRGRISPGDGRCDLFIYPGYRFHVVDAMITNFHLPKSTLLMLVAAFTGRERILSAYREAVEMRYRFFSYGDAMMIV